MKRPVFARLITNKLWLPLMVGGITLQFAGCDPEVRTTVLGGLQTSIVGLVSAVLNAFFLALQGGSSSGSTSQPVVQAVFDSLKSMLA